MLCIVVYLNVIFVYIYTGDISYVRVIVLFNPLHMIINSCRNVFKKGMAGLPGLAGFTWFSFNSCKMLTNT